jgi:hypothetical protein
MKRTASQTIGVGRRWAVLDAEGVGSRFRARRLPSGSTLPENDSRPLPQDAIRPRGAVPRCRSGFSLMEVLLATSILLACLIVLGQMASVGRQHAEDAESLTVAQLLCQAKLNEILIGAQPMASQSATPIPEIPGWTYEVQVETLNQYDLAAIRVTVAPEETDGGTRRRGKRFSLLRWMHAPQASARTLGSPFSALPGDSGGAGLPGPAAPITDGWDE